MLNACYKNQSNLRIRVSFNKDITGALVKQIKYLKPSGATGAWTATVENATTGIIYYDITSTATIDEVGTWRIWPFIQFASGREAPGFPVDLIVLNQGEKM